MNTQPEPIVVDLTDGSHFTALMHVESGKLHINLGWVGTFVVMPESARQVCSRILQLLGYRLTHDGFLCPNKDVRTNG